MTSYRRERWHIITSEGIHITPDGLSVELICRKSLVLGNECYGYVIDGEFLYHRVGEPAQHSFITGYVSWFIDEMPYWNVREYCVACGFSDEEMLMWVLKYGDYLPGHVDQL